MNVESVHGRCGSLLRSRAAHGRGGSKSSGRYIETAAGIALTPMALF